MHTQIHPAGAHEQAPEAGDTNGNTVGELVLGQGEEEGGGGHGEAHHGVGRRHPVLLGPLGLQLDNCRDAGPLPPYEVLQALTDVHDQVPDQDQLPSDVCIKIPEPETEEEGTEGFLSKLCSKQKYIIPKFASNLQYVECMLFVH